MPRVVVPVASWLVLSAPIVAVSVAAANPVSTAPLAAPTVSAVEPVPLATVATAATVPTTATTATTATTVALQPLGYVEPGLIEALAGDLGAFVGGRVTVLPARELPTAAYYPPRQRYRGDRLLDFLDHVAGPEVAHVIGITSQDISVTRGTVADWGVFGVAKLAGRPGIVSTYRLRAHAASPDLFETRLKRVAAHELGHSLGLPHCPNGGCLMQDAEGSIRGVDESSGRLCAACAIRFAQALQ